MEQVQEDKIRNKKYVRHNLFCWFVYSAITSILLIPFGIDSGCTAEIGLKLFSISLIVGFFFGLLNAINNQLRKLNGDKDADIE